MRPFALVIAYNRCNRGLFTSIIIYNRCKKSHIILVPAAIDVISLIFYSFKSSITSFMFIIDIIGILFYISWRTNVKCYDFLHHLHQHRLRNRCIKPLRIDVESYSTNVPSTPIISSLLSNAIKVEVLVLSFCLLSCFIKVLTMKKIIRLNEKKNLIEEWDKNEK